MFKRLLMSVFLFTIFLPVDLLFADLEGLVLDRKIKVDESKEVISGIGHVLFEKTGRIYILDRATLRRYDQNGKYIVTLIKPGEGPNELTQPVTLQMSADGKNLIAHTLERAKIIFFDMDGKSPKYYDSPKFATTGFHLNSKGDYYIQVMGKNDECLLYRLDKNFKIQNCFYSDPKRLEEPYPVIPSFNCDIDSNGNIYIADHFVYKIFVYDRLGKLLKTFGDPGKDIKTLEGRPPKQSEGKKFWAWFSQSSRIYPIQIIEDKYVFVFYQNETKRGAVKYYDIYSIDGKKIAHGSLPDGMYPCGKDLQGRLVCTKPDVSEDGLEVTNWLYIFTVKSDKK